MNLLLKQYEEILSEIVNLLTKRISLKDTENITINKYNNLVKIIDEEIKLMNLKKDVLYMKMDMYKSLIPLFKNINEFENYIQSL